MVIESAPAQTDCEVPARYMAFFQETPHKHAAAAVPEELSQHSSSSPSSLTDVNRASPHEKRGQALNCGSVQQSTVSQNYPRSEIDTALPFGSVKEAIQLFGEIMVCKTQKKPSTIKGGASYQYRQILEDLTRYREKLCSVETSTAETLDELNKAKELIQMLSKARKSFEGNSYHFGLPLQLSMSQECQEAPQSHLINRSLFVHPEQTELANIEVRENGSQSDQLECSNICVLADDMQSDVVQSPSSYLSNSLLMLSGGQSSNSVESNASHAYPTQPEEQHKFVMPETQHSTAEASKVNSLEMEITYVCTEIQKVKLELADVRDLEMKASSQVIQYKHEIEKTTSALLQAKAAAQSYSASSKSISEEMDNVKVQLSRVNQDEASLSSGIDNLKSEIERVQSELEKALHKEETTCETLNSLQNELRSVRNALMSTQANAANARDLKLTLPLEIKRVAAEADAANATIASAKEDLRRAKNEIEQAKAATAATASKIHAIEGETKAARVSESMALAEIEAISESESKVNVSISGTECDGNGFVMISLEEYNNLTNTMTTAMESANQKVSEILANVEAAKTSLKETKAKLDSASKETEAAQKDMKQAERKAEKAQEAKLAIEAELRQWRSNHEQNRRAASHPSNAFKRHRFPDENWKLTPQWKDSFHDKPVVDLETLAQALSMKMPPLEKKQSRALEHFSCKPGSIKKKNFFDKVATLVSSKDKFKRQSIKKAYSQRIDNPQWI